MKIDLKNWKKIGQDKDCATLKHSDGHQLKIAFGSLSPKMRKELMKIKASADDETNDRPEDRPMFAEGGNIPGSKDLSKEKDSERGISEAARTSIQTRGEHMFSGYAEGGQVKKPKDDVPFNKKAAADFQKGFNEGGAGEFVKNAKKLVGSLGFANGGEIPNSSQMPSEEDQLTQSAQQPIVINVGGQQQQPTPQQAAIRQNYNNIVGPREGSPSDMRGMGGGLNNKFDGPNVPEAINPDAMQQAVDTFKDQEAAKQQAIQLEQQKLEAQNQARQAAGMPPLPQPGDQAPALNPLQTPGSPVGDAAAANVDPGLAAQANRAPSASQAVPSVMGAYNKDMQAISLEAKAQADLGKAQAKALEDDIAIQKASLEHYTENFGKLQGKRQKIQEEYAAGEINPDHYWESKSTGSQIATMIGLLLGGIGAGLAKGENVALKTMEAAIDRDVNAQKANLDKKGNLLRYNMEEFKNLEDATRMTKVMQMDLVGNQLKLAAAKATDPMSKARALQAAAAVERATAPLMAQTAKAQSTAAIMEAIRQDPSKLQMGIRALEQIDPEKAKDLKERGIPGVGIANTGKDASAVKEIKVAVDSAKEGLNELLKLSNKSGKSLSLDDRAKAEVIQQSLVGLLRLPLTGPGAMNEGERKMLENMIANPTNVFSMDSSSKVRLKTLMKRLDSNLKAQAKNAGVEGYTGMSKEETSRLSLAKQRLAKDPNDAVARKYVEKFGSE